MDNERIRYAAKFIVDNDGEIDSLEGTTRADDRRRLLRCLIHDRGST